MTAAVHRSGTPSLGVPQTQNTAPVLEFNCLYTHDIRRKQKRWQDGFLRFHTFNKRVMVYDVPRNFIGDTHWKADEALQDGDEVMLEKDGVVVQVAESVGRTETDLTELRKSKNKGPTEHGSPSPLRPAQTPARIPNGTRSGPPSQLKHRSLNALLGTPKAPIGKAALPTRSPFEERQAQNENDEWEGGRAPKRQRVEPAAAWNITRKSKPTTDRNQQDTPRWTSTVNPVKRKKKSILQSGQQRLDTKEVIDLCDDVDESDRFLPGFSSDALMSPSSPKEPESVQKQQPVRSSSPAFSTQNMSSEVQRPTTSNRDKTRHKRPETDGYSSKKFKEDSHNATREPAEPEPPRNSRVELSERAVASANEQSTATKPPSSKSGQTLRVAAGAPKKKTLLCQHQLSQKPKRAHSADTGIVIEATSQEVAPAEKSHRSQKSQLQDRLARIKSKPSREDDSIDLESLDMPDDPAVEQRTNNSTELADDPTRPGPQNIPQQNTPTTLTDLDQMIMPRPSPESTRKLRRISNKPPHNHPHHPSAPSTNQPPKSNTKKPAQRATSVNLNTTSTGTSTVLLSRPFQAPLRAAKAAPPPREPIAREPDPWSREAFDLFIWRPPGWDEEGWCVQEGRG